MSTARSVALCVLVALSGCDSEREIREQTGSDLWYQAPNNEVDILWVVDDSCSMSEEQATLAAGFQSFMSRMEASGTDFHIGVISTSFEYDDPDRGALIGDPPFLTNEDDYVQGFVDRATSLGIDGSDKEKGLEAAAHALSPSMTFGGANDGFIRATAQLLMIFVSDEEDCSDEGALGDQAADQCYHQSEKLVPVQEYIQDFRSMKADKNNVQVGAIVGTTSSVCDDAYPGRRYISVAKHTGGLVEDICQAEWSNTLAELGLTASGIRTTFQTEKVANEETMVVMVGEVEVPMDPVNGWTYDPATCFLTFGPGAVPPRDAAITAEYTVSPGTCGETTSL